MPGAQKKTNNNNIRPNNVISSE